MRRRLVLTAALAVAVSACGGDAEPMVSSTSTTLSVVTTVQAAPSPQAVLDLAVSEAIAAGSYAFVGTVQISVAGGVAETRLEGWVEGGDRLLRVELDGQQQTTSVADGVATVVRGDQSTQISLRDAGEAPSLDLLRAVEDVRRANEVDLTGLIPASVLSTSGFDVTGDAHVVVRLTEDGRLAGYDISSSDLTWSMTIDFSEFGAVFSG